MIDNRMFSGGTAIENGPPAAYPANGRPRRRRFSLFRVILAVVILCLIALVSYAFLNPALPPTVLLDSANSSLEAARKAGALRYAEPMLRQAEALAYAGRMEMALQNGRLAPFRDYGKADSLLWLAQQTALEASVKSRDSLANVRGQFSLERAELQSELISWLEALNGSLAKLNYNRYWSSAELQLKISDRLATAGEYDNAQRSLAVGRAWLAKLSEGMTSYNAEDANMLKTWRRWVAETIEESRATGAYAIIVDKAAHKTYLIKGGERFHTYNCELGYGSANQKMFSGDGATPEGRYHITQKRHRGSKFYKALNINYPNDSDRRRFAENKSRGIISQKARIGGWIEIHGHGGKGSDWTEGCVALRDKDMDHIMQFVSEGTPVTIVRRSDRWP